MEVINEYIVQPFEQNWEFMLIWYGLVCPPVAYLLWKWVHRNEEKPDAE